ncbi:MAG TPA: phosphoheptose isomerase [Candidatus Omnitrophica bacterium]|nr:MAG: phosphoheptose isomerase [Omnitrophica WOR_2 bacterium GWA2_53_43]HCI44391.1 phosphoheptose isomerase [Candidatus Omnitrophota bacterium]
MERIFRESIRVKEETLKNNSEKIVQSVESIRKLFTRNGKILFFGNGGSAADSQHIAAEFIGRFRKERRALPAIALTTDTSILTALGNDYSFDVIFARQIEGLAQRGDLAFGISTSGNSRNVIEGIKQAKKMGLKTISLTGCGGGKLAPLTDISIIVPSAETARIQESHICIAHAICELVEERI